MNANNLNAWHHKFKPSDWPDGTLGQMSSTLFTGCVFPLRSQSGVPMWPSKLFEAHVRSNGNSQHSTQGSTRLSRATDMHVSTIVDMLTVFNSALSIKAIGGIGIYFDTNTPMFHIDERADRLVWLRTKKGEYVYMQNDIIKFYKVLASELSV